MSQNLQSMLSIGALSKATDIPVQTLRTWERRYGFPKPMRQDSGHRRYPYETILRLRQVKRALDMGAKPSNVLTLNETDLRRLISLTCANKGATATAACEHIAMALRNWLMAARALEGTAFDHALRVAWQRWSTMPFLEKLVSPFLKAVGELWADDELEIFHEHFVSDRLSFFLNSQWRSMSDCSAGPRVVCATLPDELHSLGLHMAAVALSMAGLRIDFLGTSTPVGDIARAAHLAASSVVVLSASAHSQPDEVDAQLARLRERLDPSIPIWIGGDGVVEPPAYAILIKNFPALLGMARQLAGT